MKENEITLALPLSAGDVATLQREAEANAPAYALVEVSDADSYTFADALLTDVVRKKDAVIAMRKQATTPLYQVLRTVEGWFRPVVQALETSETTLKQAMGAYRVEQANAERLARAAAADAAEAGDAERLLLALTTASAISAPIESRASVTIKWVVAAVDVDALPREFLCPDMGKINAAAFAALGEDNPPVIPGVVFEKTARIGARR
jgi:hypothetical protein